MLKNLFKYGAVSGKTHAMYGKRLTPADFIRLANAGSVSEVAAFLRASPAWGGALSGFDMSDVHRGALEMRLRWGLAKDYIGLSSFAQAGQKELMRSLSLRVEMIELMRFLRYLAAGHPGDYTPSFPEGYFSRRGMDYRSLSAAGSYGEFLEAIPKSPFSGVLKDFWLHKDGIFDYGQIEMLLWRYYYRKLWDAAGKVPGVRARAQLLSLVGTQVDFKNMIHIIRLKTTFNISEEETVKYILPLSGKLKPEDVKSLAAAPDAREAMRLVKEGPYRSAFGAAGYENIEDYYYAELYRQCDRLLHNGVPSAATPMAYLLLKEIELKNLITAVECVRYKIPANNIPSYFVGINRFFEEKR